VALLLTLVTIHAAWQVVIALVNLVAFPVLKPARPGCRPVTSLLVPARDEEFNLRANLPGLLAQGADEVVILDDQSGDATAAVVADAAARGQLVRLVTGAPLPAGWSGKNWACAQLARAASGEVLVFADADVSWSPGALEALLAERERTEADLLSAWPYQVTGGLIERITVPSLETVLLGLLPYPALTALKAPGLAAANGQLMLWRRTAYERLGGHAAFRAEVLEDVRMAQGAKAAGMRVRLVQASGFLATRMYKSAAEVFAGFAKNVLAAAGGRRHRLILIFAVNLLTFTLSFPLALLDPRWLAPGLLGIALRMVAGAKTGRRPWEGFLQPLTSAPWAVICWRALLKPGYRWKGREYP
jgi:glycosyltransferase involved in cell wall biosynthesis